MKTKELVDTAIEFSDNCLNVTGQIMAAIYIHTERDGKNELYVIPYKDGSAPVGEQQDMTISVIKQLRRDGVFRGVAMVSEAWAAKAVNGTMLLRPALDPDREETIVIYARGFEDKKVMTIFNLDRSTGKPLRGERHPMDGCEPVSWLDDAFEKEGE